MGFYAAAEKHMLQNWKPLLEKKHNSGIPFANGPTNRGGTTTPKVLPPHHWKLNIYEDYREEICDYFCEHGIDFHEQIGHLLSSQAFCLNLLWAGRRNLSYVSDLLRSSLNIPAEASLKIEGIEFEWNDYKIVYDKFGEKTGRRGFKQTSTNAAIFYRLEENGNFESRILLIEFKFTEGAGKGHPNVFGKCHFGSDEGRMQQGCTDRRSLLHDSNRCPLQQSDKKPQWYWKFINEYNGGPFKPDFLQSNGFCPFRFDGYQLMRNHLLGWLYEGRENRRYDFLVLYDARNEKIEQRPIQISEHEWITFDEWKNLVRDGRFYHISIQKVWESLNMNSSEGHRKYIEERYLNWGN